MGAVRLHSVGSSVTEGRLGRGGDPAGGYGLSAGVDTAAREPFSRKRQSYPIIVATPRARRRLDGRVDAAPQGHPPRVKAARQA